MNELFYVQIDSSAVSCQALCVMDSFTCVINGFYEPPSAKQVHLTVKRQY